MTGTADAVREDPAPQAPVPVGVAVDRRMVPARVSYWLPLIACLIAVWVAGWAAEVWHATSVPSPFEHLDHWFRLRSLRTHRVAEQLAELGDAGRFSAILAVVVLLCVLGRSWRALLGAFVSLGAVLLLVEVLLKPLVDARPSPYSIAAFPSGHTATTCCLATVAILLLARRDGPLRFPKPRPLRWVIVLLGVAIGPAVGVSMVIVGAHTAIDVIAALPLGVVVALLSCAAVDRLTGRPPGSRPTT